LMWSATGVAVTGCSPDRARLPERSREVRGQRSVCVAKSRIAKFKLNESKFAMAQVPMGHLL
jgi:hypothetical protein